MRLEFRHRPPPSLSVLRFVVAFLGMRAVARLSLSSAERLSRRRGGLSCFFLRRVSPPQRVRHSPEGCRRILFACSRVRRRAAEAGRRAENKLLQRATREAPQREKGARRREREREGCGGQRMLKEARRKNIRLKQATPGTQPLDGGRDGAAEEANERDAPRFTGREKTSGGLEMQKGA
ncbi:hypothetical protein BESB_049160 [Besnoitia besnoiti]|uniref:Uncharacterized protein n=1 Tax=Besnoitia besnoiti TaxID=94643 RepID=A0A2A9MHQ9_BESBE|nr:hypothetical protein BESB_049160 [Besnoitia besnoiti]PFH36724.1 hypothetical protein BESB_049160 [Besnoitia besnoiti]